VEQGRTFAEWRDKAKFHTISKAITLQQDAEWAWDALTNGTVMSEWHDGEVHSDPVLGGALRIVRDDAYNIGGEWVLLSRPRNLVSHQWNATSLAEKNDPGVITVQQWLILPAMEGSVVTLTEYGHDRKVVTSGSLRRIERRWDTLLGNLQQLAATN
jgi:hypothetical protein